MSDRVNEIIQKLTERAKEDGVITDEEENILQAVEQFSKQYNSYLRKAEEDGIITEEESNKLKKMRAQMLEGAWLKADDDNTITEDESALLDLLLKLLKNIEHEDLDP